MIYLIFGAGAAAADLDDRISYCERVDL